MSDETDAVKDDLESNGYRFVADGKSDDTFYVGSLVVPNPTKAGTFKLALPADKKSYTVVKAIKDKKLILETYVVGQIAKVLLKANVVLKGGEAVKLHTASGLLTKLDSIALDTWVGTALREVKTNTNRQLIYIQFN